MKTTPTQAIHTVEKAKTTLQKFNDCAKELFGVDTYEELPKKLRDEAFALYIKRYAVANPKELFPVS